MQAYLLNLAWQITILWTIHHWLKVWNYKLTCIPSKLTNYYRSLVGKLIFLTSAILNIAVVVNLVSRYMQRPQEPHLKTTKSNLWYLKGTINIGLFHRRGIGLAFTKFINVDSGENANSRKSTKGYIFSLGGTSITWNKKQNWVFLSSTNFEYMAFMEVAKKVNGFWTYLLSLAWLMFW